MKKVLAFLLAFTLLLVPFGSLSFAAASGYTDVTLTSTDGWNTSFNGSDWVLYLNTSGYTSTDWSNKYEGLTFAYEGKTYTTTQVSSAENNKLYCTIPGSIIPYKDGAVFTIKAGQYEPDIERLTQGIHITDDFTIVAVDGHLTHTKVIDTNNVEAFNSSANSFYFSVKDASGNPISTGYDSWDNFLSPSYCDETKIGNDSWSNTYSGVFVDGAPIDYWGAHFKNCDPGIFYINGLNAVSGTTVTVKGHFVSSTQAEWSVNGSFFLDELTFVYDGTNWNVKGATQITEHTGKPEFDQENGMSGFYFTAGETEFPYDADNWSIIVTAEDDDESGIFLNGNKTSVYLKKVNADLWYVCLSDAGVVPEDGDEITIAGSFTYKNHRITFDEATFKYEGGHFSKVIDYAITDFTVTGLNYSAISYNTELSHWNMYFNVSQDIPGISDGTYYPNLTYAIDGTEYTANWYKSDAGLCILIPELPQSLDEEYVITLKAGTAQGRNSADGSAADYGIRLIEDYRFVVGDSHKASAPVIDYLSVNGGDQNGIFITVNDNFPITGWDYAITKSNNTDGIFVNDQSTDVFIKKHDANKYYVCLSDAAMSAEEGTTVLLKGRFTVSNLSFVTFQTAKYIYTGGQWKVYSTVEDTGSTGVSGDANGDGKFNIIDLVHIKKYVLSATQSINLSDADLNGDGSVDASDLVLTRKLLLGVIAFEDGANITGAPAYEDNAEMRLSAYVSPTVEEGFDDYKAAGFTTLISENRAVYGTDGFAEYMNLAEEKGLDVIVQSGNFQQMLTGNVAYNAAWLQQMCKDLSAYKSFRGLFMGDEPKIADLGSYTTVVNALKTINPNMDLFTSCLPTYTDEKYLSADNKLSLNEKYANYANTFGKLFGEFTYDFYPFRHRYESLIGIKYDEKDYMRFDWFQNLNLVASNAKGAYNTGITVQSYSEQLNAKDHYRDVTKADVSFQVYSALAYGMKSINYFTYGEHWDSSVGTTSCMIYKGQKTAVYDAVKAVNTEIKAFDHILLNFNWQGTVGITGSNKNGIMNYVENYTSKRISAYSASDDAIIGCLRDGNGYDGFMLVNAADPSLNVTESISVTFKNADHAKVFVNGTESIVELNNGTYAASLAPGQGIFVIPFIA